MLWYELQILTLISFQQLYQNATIVSGWLKCQNVPCTICGSDHCNSHFSSFTCIEKQPPIISWDDLRSDWYWLTPLLILVDKLTSLCLLSKKNLHEESYWTFGVFLLHDVPSNVSSVFALCTSTNENIIAVISNLLNYICTCWVAILFCL
jgi:hypothetical protein